MQPHRQFDRILEICKSFSHDYMTNKFLVILISFFCYFCVSFASDSSMRFKSDIYTAYSEELQRRAQVLLADEFPMLRFTRQYIRKLDELTFEYAVELGIKDSFLRKIEELPQRRTGVFVSYRSSPWYVVDFGSFMIAIIGEDLYHKIHEKDVQITVDDIKLYMEGMIKLYDIMYGMSLKRIQKEPNEVKHSNAQ